MNNNIANYLSLHMASSVAVDQNEHQLVAKFFYANNDTKKLLHFDTLSIHNSANIALSDMNSVINLLQN
jgi:hypothetical protein